MSGNMMYEVTMQRIADQQRVADQRRAGRAAVRARKEARAALRGKAGNAPSAPLARPAGLIAE